MHPDMHDTELNALLDHFEKQFHPKAYDCRHCDHNLSHCAQRAIEVGQKPDVLFISCDDSRDQPNTLFGTVMGEAFGGGVIAALVPARYGVVTRGLYKAIHKIFKAGKPKWADKLAGAVDTFESKFLRHESTSVWARIEYGVLHLGIKRIVVLGHTQCGGIAAMVGLRNGKHCGGAIDRHLGMSLDSVERVYQTLGAKAAGMSEKEIIRLVEEETIRQSVQHVKDWVAENVPHASEIKVHGWQYDMRDANVWSLKDDGSFVRITRMASRMDYGHLPASCEEGMKGIMEGKRLRYAPPVTKPALEEVGELEDVA